MSVPTNLRFFRVTEFSHPDLVNERAVRYLDAIRGLYGAPLVITSDARTVAENAAASGSSPTSWHLTGRAFDIRMPTTPEALWRLVYAVVLAMGRDPVELELVQGPTDHHVHLGFPDDGRPSTLELHLT
jgi:peptidase M15-like protein